MPVPSPSIEASIETPGLAEVIQGSKMDTESAPNLKALWRAVARVASSLLCAGLLFGGWLALFLLTVNLDGAIVTAIRWLSGPVVTAAGFAAGILISGRLTHARPVRFFRVFLWPLAGCAIGAGAVYWIGPMLIVFGMFAAGTASVVIREVVLYVAENLTGHHIENGDR